MKLDPTRAGQLYRERILAPLKNGRNLATWVLLFIFGNFVWLPGLGYQPSSTSPCGEILP